MALKTVPTNKDVDQFIESIENEQKRADCQHLRILMTELVDAEPVMWGESIVGFGSYHYKYDSGQEGDWFLTGFAPRKQNLTIYLMAGLEKLGPLLEKLGKHKHGKGCLYVKRLEDVDEEVLIELINESTTILQKRYPPTES